MLILAAIACAWIPASPESCSGFADSDGDGYGDPYAPVSDCETPSVANDHDCTDADATAFPDADEVCDGVDNDCDGSVDEGFTRTWPDADGDGFGDEALGSECAEGGAEQGGDCDDQNAAVNPDAEDLCDAVDDNCSGDENDASDADSFFADLDGDGYGTPDAVVRACEQPADAATNDGDCDDGRADVNPGEPGEICDNGLDDNCDGEAGDCAFSGEITSDFTIDPESMNGQIATVAVGDVSGDGIPDLLLGGPEEGANYHGRVVIFAGPITGAPTETAAFLGHDAQGRAGGELAVGGDVDGDTLGDLLIGAPNAEGGRGAAYLIRGGALEASTDLSLADAVIIGEAPADYLSENLDATYTGGPSIGGDVDGDGKDDVLVNGGGRAYLVHEPAGSVDAGSADARFDAPGLLGVTLLRDADGDGYDELAFGAAGGVMLVRGGPDVEGTITLASEAVAVWTDTGGSRSLAALGEVTGDGVPDLGVANNTGSVWIFDGDTTGTHTVSEATARWSNSAYNFPFTGGDFDGDGQGDLSLSGALFQHVVYGPVSGELSGAAVTGYAEPNLAVGAGDLDDDGDDDILAVASGWHLVYVYLGGGF